MPLIPYSREYGLYAHKPSFIPTNRPPNNAGTMQDGLGCVKMVAKVACKCTPLLRISSSDKLIGKRILYKTSRI